MHIGPSVIRHYLGLSLWRVDSHRCYMSSLIVRVRVELPWEPLPADIRLIYLVQNSLPNCSATDRIPLFGVL